MAKFCGKCGTRLDIATGLCPKCDSEELNCNLVQENVDEVSVHCPVEGSVETKMQLGTEGVKSEAPVIIDTQADEERLQSSTGKAKKATLLVASLVILFLGLVYVVFSLMGRINKADSPIVALSNGKYYVINDYEKGKAEAIEIADRGTENKYAYYYNSNEVYFSEDGKYVYYLTYPSADEITASLWRAEYRKLKKDSPKNENYVELIDTNVGQQQIWHLADDNFFYGRSYEDENGEIKGEFCHFDGNVSTVFPNSEALDGFLTDGNKRIVFSRVNDEDSSKSDIYSATIDHLEDATLIAEGCEGWNADDNLDNIVYGMATDSGTSCDYYSSNFAGESKYIGCFGKDSKILQFDNKGCIILTENGGKPFDISERIVDEFKDSDSELTIPQIEDYEIPVYEYQELLYADPPMFANDAEELYLQGQLFTSCTKPFTYVSIQHWSSILSYQSRSFEYVIEDEAHGDDFKTFVDKYKDQEDEYGYILVTDEVKSDLMDLRYKISTGSYADDLDYDYRQNWWHYCFVRKNVGTTYDTEAYEAEMENWQDIISRNAVRELLAQQDGKYYDSISYFDGNELTVLSDEVVSVGQTSKGVVYFTADSLQKDIPINSLINELKSYENADEEIDRTQWGNLLSKPNDEVHFQYIELQNGQISTTQISDSTLTPVVQDAIKDDNIGNSAFLVTDTDVFYFNYKDEPESAIYHAQNENGFAEGFEVECENVLLLGKSGDQIYYYKKSATTDGENYYSGLNNYAVGGNRCSDLYRYSDGASTCLVRDVELYSAEIYEDAILVHTGYDPEYGSGLCMYDKDGNGGGFLTDFSKPYCVKHIYRTDGSVVYVSNNTEVNKLYYFDGQKDQELMENVDWVWSSNRAESVVSDQMPYLNVLKAHQYGRPVMKKA